MDVGIPRELKDHEYRVAITPVGVRELTDAGHRVIVEQGAGLGSSITDLEFEKSGATVLETADEVWGEADMVLKVKEPVPEEFHRLQKDQVLFTYLHLAASREVTEALLDSGTTAVAYETVELADGRLPLLAPMSEVAGRMAPQVGAHLLERESGGRGVLMGGVSGVAAAKVLVLGGGMAGHPAPAPLPRRPPRRRPSAPRGRPPNSRSSRWAPTWGAIRPATSLMGASSGSRPSASSTVS